MAEKAKEFYELFFNYALSDDEALELLGYQRQRAVLDNIEREEYRIPVDGTLRIDPLNLEG